MKEQDNYLTTNKNGIVNDIYDFKEEVGSAILL
jgi:hypothetical protein